MPQMKLMTRWPIMRAFRKRVLRARRNQNHANQFEAGLDEIRRLYGEFGEWRCRWEKRRDEAARQKAVETLCSIYRHIRKLSRNSHRLELVAFLRQTRIPGWRKALTRNPPRSR